MTTTSASDEAEEPSTGRIICRVTMCILSRILLATQSAQVSMTLGSRTQFRIAWNHVRCSSRQQLELSRFEENGDRD